MSVITISTIKKSKEFFQKYFKNKLQISISFALLMFLSSTALNNKTATLSTNKAPTVTTDQEDYSPGDTAIITATDFNIGETVEFQVLHIGGKPNTGNGHLPWQVTDGGVNDLDGIADGNITTTWYVDPDDSLNSIFELTANGLTSGFTASTTFTDDVAFPTNVVTNYNPATDILEVTIDWEWIPSDKKVVTVAVFADINGDGLTPTYSDNPNTWQASTTSGDGNGINLANPSDEFLGQISSSSIEGMTSTGDTTDNGIGSQALAAASLNANTPHVLFPYDFTVVDDVLPATNPPTGTFTLTYTGVTVAPKKLCVILYDIHVNKNTATPIGATWTYDVVDGRIKNGMGNNLNVANFEGSGYTIINGLVDVSGINGIDNADDLAAPGFFGYQVINGFVNVKDDNKIDHKDDGIISDAQGYIDDLSGKHSVISAGTGHNTDNSIIDASNNNDVTCDNPINNEIVFDCPAPVDLPCKTEQEIIDAYDAWVDGFFVIGGCDTVNSNIGSIPSLQISVSPTSSCVIVTTAPQASIPVNTSAGSVNAVGISQPSSLMFVKLQVAAGVQQVATSNVLLHVNVSSLLTMLSPLVSQPVISRVKLKLTGTCES